MRRSKNSVHLVHGCPKVYRQFSKRGSAELQFIGMSDKKYLARIDERWWGRYFEIPEHGPPIIYAPSI
jgi:hypothetical protein